MTPSEPQAEAVQRIIAWYRDPKSPQEFYLAGYAGVGKSTVAKMAIDELRDKCKIGNIVTCAYTGKAANVLRKKGVDGAMTAHSAIYRAEEDEKTGLVKFRLSADAPAADAELIVLDECSMIDADMANDLRSYDKKILVMGDPGQLPPVRGLGEFTNRKPDVFLTEIHRQAAGSPIIRLATAARKGEPIKLGVYSDEVKVEALSNETAEAINRTDTQVICGLHKVRHVVTARMRRNLGFDGRFPIKGERIICRKNNRERGIFNGGQGNLIDEPEVVDDHLFLSVAMDDLKWPLHDIKTHPWLFDQHRVGVTQRPRIERGVDEFDFGYALTVHSAQGSEWPHVTVIDDSGSFREDRQKWLYTAITRASSGLTLLRRA